MNDPDAAPTLDAQLAEQLMGLHRTPDGAWCWVRHAPVDARRCATATHPPRYSSDLAAAWRLVEALAARGWRLTLTGPCPAWDWQALFAEFVADRRVWASAPTVPLALARAALRAVGAADATSGGGNRPQTGSQAPYAPSEAPPP